METFTKAIVKISAAILLSFAAVSSYATDRNGNWWIGLNKEAKIQYIVGVFDGIKFQNSREDEWLIGPASAFGTKMPCDEACVKSRFEIWENLEEGLKDFSAITAGQLTDGADSLLEDYRNRSISLVDILEVVIMSIKGASPVQVEARLSVLRKNK